MPTTDAARLHVLELCSAVVMAMSAVATAWTGYQAVRWGGVQATRYSEASGRRVEASMASAAAGQLITIDVGTFLHWIDATAAGDSTRAAFLRARFRPAFRPTFESWLASQPLHADRATTPFERPDYRAGQLAQARRIEKKAAMLFEEGQRANDLSDKYSFVTVVLASGLFFAGIAPQFRRIRLRTLIVGSAGLLCLAGLAVLLTLPVA
jgi:hypothetical protein